MLPAMKSAPLRQGAILLLATALFSVLRAAAPTPAPASLNAHGQALLSASVRFGDRLWDDRAGLLWTAEVATPGQPRRHMVRDTTWYALGLMMRDGPGDRARALRALDVILGQQIREPALRNDIAVRIVQRGSEFG